MLCLCCCLKLATEPRNTSRKCLLRLQSKEARGCFPINTSLFVNMGVTPPRSEECTFNPLLTKIHTECFLKIHIFQEQLNFLSSQNPWQERWCEVHMVKSRWSWFLFVCLFVLRQHSLVNPLWYHNTLNILIKLVFSSFHNHLNFTNKQLLNIYSHFKVKVLLH